MRLGAHQRRLRSIYDFQCLFDVSLLPRVRPYLRARCVSGKVNGNANEPRPENLFSFDYRRIAEQFYEGVLLHVFGHHIVLNDGYCRAKNRSMVPGKGRFEFMILVCRCCLHLFGHRLTFLLSVLLSASCECLHHRKHRSGRIYDKSEENSSVFDNDYAWARAEWGKILGKRGNYYNFVVLRVSQRYR